MSIPEQTFSPLNSLDFPQSDQDESPEVKEDDEKHMGFSIVDILNATKPK